MVKLNQYLIKLRYPSPFVDIINIVFSSVLENLTISPPSLLTDLNQKQTAKRSPLSINTDDLAPSNASSRSVGRYSWKSKKK